MTRRDEVPPRLLACVEAARSKQAVELKVLDLRGLASFTDYFVISSGSSQRQIQAIADAVRERLKAAGAPVAQLEGYAQAEWVLMDCGEFVVHVFSSAKRDFYDLERLWSDAVEVEIPVAAA